MLQNPNAPLVSTARKHCQDFKTYLATSRNFAQEVSKLSPLEIEILSISSTLAELEQDKPYFNAAEVSRTFEFNIRIDKRNEVRQMLLGRNEDAAGKIYREAGSNGKLLQSVLLQPTELKL